MGDVRDEMLSKGSIVAEYEVDEIIGRGGMGIVYSATHQVIGKRAAIKVLRAEVSQNPTTVQRFIQEAQAVNAIGHPNIIDIFAFGKLPDGRAYHLMDLMVGESLRQRLRRGPLHPSEAASVLEGVASALMAAHDKGFIHRDLKPDNIFLVPNEGSWPDTKLLDFGLAKLMPDMGQAAFTTKTGVMLGTPEYMSPEQARGDVLDYRTDVYSLGIVMYEILVGERPFPAADPFTTLHYHSEEPAPSIGAAIPQLPAEMVQLIDAMLAKTPPARPSLAAVRAVIKRLRSTQLPTHSIAGQQLDSLKPDMQQIDPSRLGAAPVSYSLPTPPNRARSSSSQPPLTRPLEDHADEAATVPRGNKVSTPPATSGLAKVPSLHGTRLGVTPARAAVSQRMPTQPPVAPKSSPWWLVLGALLFIAAGIGLALVLVGR